MKYLLDSLILSGQFFKHCFTVADIQHPEQPLIHINGNFEEMTGYSKKEVVGQNCRFMQGAETSKETVKKIRETIDNSEIGYFDLVNYKKNKEKFINRLLLIPVGLSSQTVRYYVGIQIESPTKQGALLNSNDVKNKNPELFSELEKHFKDIINFFRGYEYLQISQGNLADNEKVSKLAAQINEKIAKMCSFIENITP